MRVILVDYGAGNLMSIARALEFCNIPYVLTSDTKTIESASHLIIPGVGAFGQCMEKINKNNLVEPIKSAAAADAKILGICVGMQVLFEKGFEFGEHEGLGLIEGEVMQIPATTKKLPNIGWSTLNPLSNDAKTPIQLTDTTAYYYFVHSYMCVPNNAENRLATYTYDGIEITAACIKNNIVGTQFHPEKSGTQGLRILKSFFENR